MTYFTSEIDGHVGLTWICFRGKIFEKDIRRIFRPAHIENLQIEREMIVDTQNGEHTSRAIAKGIRVLS